MSVHLDRFLNIPPTPLPEPDGPETAPETLLAELPALLDERQRVDAAGGLVARYLYDGGDAERLLALLGSLLLREDRNFHTIQAVEAAFSQHASLRGTVAGTHVLVAAGAVPGSALSHNALSGTDLRYRPPSLSRRDPARRVSKKG